jgi:NADP-reducing hydrogenase subunit HndB
MKITSREDFKKLREEAKQKVSARNAEGIKIIVGMGTCGIAAGAQNVMAAILEEVNKRNLQVIVDQTGLERWLEVRSPNLHLSIIQPVCLV